MAIIRIKGINVAIDGADERGSGPWWGVRASGTQLAQLTQTLDLLPVDHLRVLPTITVGRRPASGGGGSAHRRMPGGPYIRLNYTCFQSAWNRGPYNYTLLHEAGHIVDWAYECMVHMRQEDAAGYRVLINYPHRGRTQGPSEHYADAYADLLSRKSISEARRSAVIRSRAFQRTYSAAG